MATAILMGAIVISDAIPGGKEQSRDGAKVIFFFVCLCMFYDVLSLIV